MAPLVAVEDQLDLLARAGGLAAAAAVAAGARAFRPERAMPEVTAVVSWPVSEPAPVPKPRLLSAEVMPPLPAPTFEVMSERSACASAPTAPERFLVSSGFRSMTSRRSASSSLT